MFCSWAKLGGKLPYEMRQSIIEDYEDVRKHGFHCQDEEHVKAFHKIVGHHRNWSCCRQHHELGVVDKVNNPQESDSENEAK